MTDSKQTHRKQSLETAAPMLHATIATAVAALQTAGGCRQQRTPQRVATRATASGFGASISPMLDLGAHHYHSIRDSAVSLIEW
jgi:hypothetical protein